MVTAIVTIVIFLIMISLHEFGHFIFGKLLGFKVLEYAIGFGPAIFKRRGRETLYTIRAVPFGGFCRFAGEDEQSKAEEGNFNEQPCWKRIIVLAAGAVFNVVLGFIIFCFLVYAGKTVYTNTIQSIVPGTYLEDTDIQPGDRIISLNDKKISMYRDIQLYTSDIVSGDTIKMTVDRGGEKRTVEFMPSLQNIRIEYGENEITYKEVLNGNSTVQTIPYSDENPKNESLVGTVQEQERYLIGFSPAVEDVTYKNLIPQSFNMTKYVVKLLYRTVWELATGRGSMDQLSGPIGIVREFDNAVNSGDQSIIYVLNLVALLTINLGVFNLLPLPALDGGRLLFVLIEWVRGKPVSPEKEGMVHTVGFLLLMLFMLFVSYRDILRLF